MTEPELKLIVEAALLAAGEPLTLDRLAVLFDENRRPDRKALREALQALDEDYADRAR